MKYILNADGIPVQEPDLMKWAEWYETADRIVKQTRLGVVAVSTVFLGLDHNFGLYGKPLLYETMIFGGAFDQFCDRYATREEALEGHATQVALMQAVIRAQEAENAK